MSGPAAFDWDGWKRSSALEIEAASGANHMGLSKDRFPWMLLVPVDALSAAGTCSSEGQHTVSNEPSRHYYEACANSHKQNCDRCERDRHGSGEYRQLQLRCGLQRHGVMSSRSANVRKRATAARFETQPAATSHRTSSSSRSIATRRASVPHPARLEPV